VTKTPKVLFLARGNASRGHIAEGYLRTLAGDKIIPFSAGTEGADVSPIVKEVMSEDGIDISQQQSHDIPSLFRESFQYVVVLCDEQRERYPLFPFARKPIHWSIPDPETVESNPEMKKEAFRTVRNEVRTRVKELLKSIDQSTTTA